MEVFQIELSVRDYECDMQGIVNNAVYLNYFEHARHEYLHHLGIDFKSLFLQNIVLVATRIEIDYKRSLKSGDKFIVTVKLEKPSTVRYVFDQDILIGQDVMTRAKTTVASLNEQGKPTRFNII
jgi:acyl-CoA thioester hydrolase